MAVAAALFAGYSAYSGQNSNELSDVALINVEALAQSGDYEYPDGLPVRSVCGVVVSVGTFFDTKCSRIITECQGGGSGCNSSKCPHHDK